jgi:hypothetical protein
MWATGDCHSRLEMNDLPCDRGHWKSLIYLKLLSTMYMAFYGIKELYYRRCFDLEGTNGGTNGVTVGTGNDEKIKLTSNVGTGTSTGTGTISAAASGRGYGSFSLVSSNINSNM